MEHIAREPDAVLRKSLQASRAAGRACLGLLLALFFVADLSACGSGQDGDKGESAQAPRSADGTPGPETAIVRVPRQVATDFALLRTSPDGIPPAVSRILKAPVSGMDWSLARRVPVPLPGAYWLAPGAEHLCVVATTPDSPAIGTVCATYGQALRNGVANTSLDPTSSRRLIVGVVPDGTRSVRIRSGDSTASARVRDGTFVHRDSVAAPPDRVTLR